MRGNAGLGAPRPEAGTKATWNAADAKTTKRIGKRFTRQLTSGAGRKDKPLRTTYLAGLAKESNRVRGERHLVGSARLHPFSRDSPDAPVEVDLFPPSTTHLEGTRRGKDVEFEHQPSEDPPIQSVDCGDD